MLAELVCNLVAQAMGRDGEQVCPFGACSKPGSDGFGRLARFADTRLDPERVNRGFAVPVLACVPLISGGQEGIDGAPNAGASLLDRHLVRGGGRLNRRSGGLLFRPRPLDLLAQAVAAFEILLGAPVGVLAH